MPKSTAKSTIASVTFFGVAYERDHLESMTSGELVKLYNDAIKSLGDKADGMVEVKRFSTKTIAAERTWNALVAFQNRKKPEAPIHGAKVSDGIPTAKVQQESLDQIKARLAAQEVPKVTLTLVPAVRADDIEEGITILFRPGTTVEPAREGSKQQLILTLLAEGATMAQLTKKLYCSEAEVKRKFAGASVKSRGYGLKLDSKGVYRLIFPVGITAVVAPRPLLKLGKNDARQIRLEV